MENGSNYFFPCSWDGEDRKWSRLQDPTCSEGGLWEQGAAGPAVDLLRGGSRAGVCVCVQVEELDREEFLTRLHCLQS